MSIDRTAIAAALHTVEGVTGHAEQPQTPRPGDAWPALATLERGPGTAFSAGWAVHVMCPGTGADAQRWAEATWKAVVTALWAVSHVERVIMPSGSPTQPLNFLTVGILAEG